MRHYTAPLAFAVFAALGVAVVAQQQPADPARTRGVQAGRDPNRAAFVAANGKAQPAAAAPAAPGGPGGNAARGGGAPAPAATFENAPTPAIPGVIAAGQKWRKVWEGS